jgi:hypothetical protein
MISFVKLEREVLGKAGFWAENSGTALSFMGHPS